MVMIIIFTFIISAIIQGADIPSFLCSGSFILAYKRIRMRLRMREPGGYSPLIESFILILILILITIHLILILIQHLSCNTNSLFCSPPFIRFPLSLLRPLLRAACPCHLARSLSHYYSLLSLAIHSRSSISSAETMGTKLS